MRDASDRNVNALQVAQVLTCTSQASNSMQTIETYEKYNIVSFRGVPIIATVKGRDESEVRVIACGAGFRSTRRGGVADRPATEAMATAGSFYGSCLVEARVRAGEGVAGGEARVPSVESIAHCSSVRTERNCKTVVP